MKTLHILVVFLVLLSVQHIYAQQDVQNANATKLQNTEKIDTPKKPQKQNSKGTTTITKVNAPTLNHAGTIIQEKPQNATPVEDKNAPVLSNQNQIVEPKKDK